MHQRRICLGRQGAGEEDDSDEVIFSCRLDNAKSITTILSCLSHGTRKDQQAQCEVKFLLPYVSFSVPEFARGYLTSSENPVGRSITYHTSLVPVFEARFYPTARKSVTSRMACLVPPRNSFDSQLIDLKNPLEVIYLALTTGQGFQ